jgi:hypothetical protein
VGFPEGLVQHLILGTLDKNAELIPSNDTVIHLDNQHFSSSLFIRCQLILNIYPMIDI